MLNFVSGRYAETVPWQHHLLRLVRWAQRLDFGRGKRATHARTQYSSPRAMAARTMDADTELMLALARKQMTDLTR